jgi:hypothetical protein
VNGRSGGLLRLVSGSELDRQDSQAQAQAQGTANRPAPMIPDIGSFIRNLWNIFRNQRNNGNNPLNDRLIRAQRMFEGKYDPDKLHWIKKFGGSEVYSRMVAGKCRGATSLLRQVYLGPDRPWGIDPQPDPPVPPEISAQIMQLVSSEVQSAKQANQPMMDSQVHMRVVGLMHAAQQAARRNAIAQAHAAEDKIEDILRDGGFYEALTEFCTDLPLFPFAVLKGPTVKMTNKLVWNGNTPSIKRIPQMFWERISPFDLYWSPGASTIEQADTLERRRYTRSDLNNLIGLPGYDEAAIRAVLTDYAHGLREWLDSNDSERAYLENREDPNFNQSEYIEGLEFNGMVQGEMLMRYGMTAAQIADPDMDYSVRAWLIGRYVIKVQMNPSPRQRHPYYVTSFEKVPGTIAGHGLCDMLEDHQEVANAAYRALVNNMSIASGPQVVINDEVVTPGTDADELYPWKRWHITMDPMGVSREPVSFFQPQDNSQALLAVYNAVSQLCDEASAIPRYITGSNAGGAGRTASGLSMLMDNSKNMLQTVAGNVDGDVMEPLLHDVYDLIMLTDTSGLLTGNEEVNVRGVNVAIEKDTERQKQLQFLQITGNPIDAPIVGVVGRARVLRSVAQGLGLPDDIVPDDQTLQAEQKQQQAQAAQQAAMNPQGQLGGQPGQPPGKPGQPNSNPAAQTQGAQPPHPAPSQLADAAPPSNQSQSMPGVVH